MIYGYTYKAPHFGDYTRLYCKNMSQPIHLEIWDMLYKSGGNWFVDHEFDVINRDPFDIFSIYEMIEYSGPDRVIYEIIEKCNIQILSSFDESTLNLQKQKKDIVKQIDLAIKLEN